MPELPEVETIISTLTPHLTSTKITDVAMSNKRLRFPYPENLYDHIINKNIVFLERRAKYILVHLNCRGLLVMHLGMSGKVFIRSSDYLPEKHDHFMLTLNDEKLMVLNDVRRFGFVDFIESNENFNDHKLFNHLGIEPLSEEFDYEYLLNICENKNISIKKLIMDQKYIVGVGNIYAVESLFLSQIHPNCPASKLKAKQAKSLTKNIKTTLEKAIIAGGSTIKDYRNGDDKSGYFQHQFQVYGREEKDCYCCKNKISRIIIGGRSTFLCQKCQKFC